jgi:preprotein translocase subunit SecG
METIVFVLHVFSCLFLISLILVQHGQGANMGAAFGGASQTVFGSRGPATFLNKLTVIVAVIFLTASVYLAQIEKGNKSTSVVDEATNTENVVPAAEKNEAVIEPETAPVEKTEEKK